MFENYILAPLLSNINSFADRNAFCIDSVFYTYQDFGQNISKIRTSIQQNSSSCKNIGLHVNDDLETYAAIFAIWLEGYAYVPLHPNQPLDRNLEIVSQAHIDLILSSKTDNFAEGLKSTNLSKLEFSELNFIPKETSDQDLAYILFTSGSTGKPKGVPITRKNIGGFMKSFWETGITIDETDRCLQCFDLTFDVSVQSFLVPLTKGACTFTIPHDQIKYSYVFGLLDDHQLTFGAMAPSMIRYLRPYFEEIDIPSMRYAILTAEASPLELVTEWAKCIPNAEIYDFYGPTEATIYCTYYKVPLDGSAKQLNGMLSIGKVMDGLTAVILDENNKILGENEKGEMCISGIQLTSGYWENTDKTEEVFFNLTVHDKTQRFYRTGDLCYRDIDGDILYSGRIDFQVKIQGYRIELGEIEHHVREFLHGQNAIVLPFENKNQNTELALFVEGDFGGEDKLITYLKSKVPAYMIPTRYITQPSFPTNSSDKIDRKKLAERLIN